MTTNRDKVDDIIVIGGPPPIEYPGFDPNPGGGGGPGEGGGGGDPPHYYVTASQVGDTSCDIDEAWEGLLRNAAPGQTGIASTGNVIDVPGLGRIMQTVNQETMTVTNTTMPGHLLHPGIVERQIISLGGAIFVETVGSGTGAFGAINSWLSSPVWNQMNSNIASYVEANDDGEGDC